MLHLRKTLTLAGAALAITAPLMATGSSALAATARNGVCESGEFCYYYNSNEAGSVSDFVTTVGDYGTTQPTCYDFKGPGAGKGQCIKNNAASVWNRTDTNVTVYFNSNSEGPSQTFRPGEKNNLNATLKNNNASHEFAGP
jgi:hypothetical protein